jgi:hypothetical protein
MDGGTKLTAAWPPAAPVSMGTGQGAGEGGVERGEPDGPLTGAWEAVRRPEDGGEGGGSQNSSAEHAWAQRVGNGGGDDCGEEGRAGRGRESGSW